MAGAADPERVDDCFLVEESGALSYEDPKALYRRLSRFFAKCAMQDVSKAERWEKSKAYYNIFDAFECCRPLICPCFGSISKHAFLEQNLTQVSAFFYSVHSTRDGGGHAAAISPGGRDRQTSGRTL